MTTETSIVGETTKLTLESGLEVNIERLRTRQLMRLLKIITVGAGDALTTITLGEDSSQEQFTSSLIAAIIFAIPEAEDETIEFLLSMVSPVGVVERAKTKRDREANEELYEELYREFQNPELEDTVEIISRVIELEAPHILSLGKRLGTLLKPALLSQEAKSSKK